MASTIIRLTNSACGGTDLTSSSVATMRSTDRKRRSAAIKKRSSK
ncbi:Uncharacterised protein [Mycobacterium tuberculosis]|nr:Uncharacterised protein [Mycobacterium tuberculosis]